MGHEMTRSVVSVLVTGFRRQRLNHDAAAPPLGSSRSNPFEDSCSHAQASSTRLRILRRCSNLSNMLAVAAPAETFASAFQMTCASEGYAVNLTLVARAFEFMDAGRQQRRIHGLWNGSALCQSLKAVAYFSCCLRRLVLLEECGAE